MAYSVVLERIPAATGDDINSAGQTLLRKRVYIFLTRYGLIFTINLIVMLLGAVNYNNSLAYALTFLLAGLFMVSMLHTYNNLKGLIISSSPSEPVFAGQQASFPLLLDNRFGSARVAVNFQMQASSKKKQKDESIPNVNNSVDIDENDLHPLNFRIDAIKRGKLIPGRIKISSTWPIGLFRAWSYLHLDQPCIIYPRPMGTKSLPEQIVLDGEEQTGTAIGTEDFLGFRQYQDGDSMRSVDWKAYARERGLQTKRFSGKGSKRILIDLQQINHISGLEPRLSQLCLWVLEADKQGAQYALSLDDKSYTDFNAGEVHKHKCLKILAEYKLS
jgi:uncharacterized protein (DUF58 family)